MCPAPELREVPVRAPAVQPRPAAVPKHGQPERLQTGREGDDRGQHPAAVRRRLHLQAARGGRQQLAVPAAGELAGGVGTGAGESAAPSRHSQTQISLNVHYSLKSIRNGKS